MQKITFGAVSRWLVCLGYGAMVGFVAITSAEVPANKIDNLAYQNFGLLAGAGIGLGLCLLGHLVYRLAKNSFHAHPKGFLFTISIATGAAIGFLASYIVHISAGSYGMIPAKTSVMVVLSIIPAVFGGIIPAIALLLVKS